ncbi:Phospholipase D1 [Puccinia graminis f. sp. tritici]|uniref:Phospholipase D1 n=1 Tax=Puccinia graminis f. sp. tritici TaxID=56615 RepID=A0A5B0MGB9_PUCGR|nr:Phospholipase D1 [Puccinia graminis f. sp. tritici]
MRFKCHPLLDRLNPELLLRLAQPNQKTGQLSVASTPPPISHTPAAAVNLIQPDTTEGQNLTSPSASNRWTAVKAKLVRGPSLIPAENAGQTTGTSSAINQLIRIKSKATTDKKNFTGPELNAQLSSGSLAITIRSSAAVVIKHFAPLEAEFTRQSRYPYHSTPDNCAFLDFQGNA